MSYDYRKVSQLIANNGFIIKKVFVQHGFCVYLELANVNNADPLLLYIPSRWEIAVEDAQNVYKLNSIDIGEDGNIPSDYGGNPDDLEMENQYDSVEIDMNPSQGGNMVENLEQNYDHAILLKDISKEDKMTLRDIFRQLRRLKYCVQNIQYKLAILFKNYICCIRRDDTFDAFTIRHSLPREERAMMISIDLENFFEKSKTVGMDIRTVRDGIYRVLDKNQITHSRNLKRLLEQRDISLYSDAIYTQKLKLAAYLENLDAMLYRVNNSEQKLVAKIIDADRKYNTSDSRGLHTDISNTYLVAKQEKELNEINIVKQEIIENILIVKAKQEKLTLSVDRIFFDTSVMLDAIIKNMAELETLNIQ
jgi:hypothetical protein